MKASLAVKNRPQDWESVLGQKAVVATLKKQLETNNISHCYLFCGPSGDGKTTIARILAKYINKGQGEPLEIDGASNNGVDNVRQIINDAKNRSIDSEYKIFIIDECHAISSQGWQAFLKCIEEPPAYTIFMFCTTNPEKIPPTIINRCMRFNLSKVDTNLIRTRLEYIANQEECENYLEACDYISKLSCGGVRDAISYLEKCIDYNKNLSIENVLECLGDFSYDSFFDFTVDIMNNDEANILMKLEEYYNSGKDLKLFVEEYLEFIIDLTKYCLFRSLSVVKIPSYLEQRCIGYSNIPNILNYSNDLVEKILNVKNTIKLDINIKNTVEAMFIAISRGE